MIVSLDTMREQRAYLERLAAATKPELISLHDRTFKGTEYEKFRPPSWVRREFWERRLWIYHLMNNYHLPPDHLLTRAFMDKADAFLTTPPFDNQTREELELLAEIKETRRFARDSIRAMPEETVMRYLTALGVHVDQALPMHAKRRCLWEIVNLPKQRTAAIETRRMRQARMDSLILKHPGMPFAPFKRKFADKLPRMTHRSWKVARQRLKTRGYKIPDLRAKMRGYVDEQEALDMLDEKSLAKVRKERANE